MYPRKEVMEEAKELARRGSDSFNIDVYQGEEGDHEEFEKLLYATMETAIERR